MITPMAVRNRSFADKALVEGGRPSKVAALRSDVLAHLNRPPRRTLKARSLAGVGMSGAFPVPRNGRHLFTRRPAGTVLVATEKVCTEGTHVKALSRENCYTAALITAAYCIAAQHWRRRRNTHHTTIFNKGTKRLLTCVYLNQVAESESFARGPRPLVGSQRPLPPEHLPSAAASIPCSA